MLHRLIRAGLAASALMLACRHPRFLKHALQDYPTRPITLIVPYSPGGGVDVIGRLVAPKTIGGARPAGGGRKPRGRGRHDRLSRSSPRQFRMVTLWGVMTSGISLNPKSAGYDVNKDFSPIGLIASTPILIVANPSFPAQSLGDLIALAKQQPGKLAAGTPPPPTINFLAVWLFKMATGVDVTVVTYKGTAQLTDDVLGNHVPLGFDTIPAAVSNVRAGQLRSDCG